MGVLSLDSFSFGNSSFFSQLTWWDYARDERLSYGADQSDLNTVSGMFGILISGDLTSDS